MGEPVLDSQKPFRVEDHAAVVLCRTERGNLHLGLLHRGVGGSVSILHLGWEDNLAMDWKWERLWAAPAVPAERLRSVSGLCRLIWEQYQATRKFPYGLHYASQFFTPDGSLQLDPRTEAGLTCSTFALAVFRTVGIELVDIASWPVRADEDRAFLEFVRPFAATNLIATLTAEVEAGCKRVQPAEVVGACADPPPVGFTVSKANGDRAILMLDL
ncbi:MAG: hypothetical protein A2Z17_01205 [Gammaproteobacteria bacterium RBG_16_66_13]|nr:MAG: hypothetical protein A2Z17_01205 [Gammaproteobacteria bacterium RBG_16_66_13]